MALPPYASRLERVWHWTYLAICTLIFLFLIAPILVIIPLSFNAEPYFTFTRDMLALNPDGYSLRWYDTLATFGMSQPDAPRGWAWLSDMWANARWVQAAKNSVVIGIAATLVATVLGTLAALGLARPEMPFRRLIMAMLISPMIVPLIITATGLFFFYSSACVPPGSWLHQIFGAVLSKEGCLANTRLGVILAHATLGIPFVIITVTATLIGFDQSLNRAAASLGASPRRVFFRVTMPLILPGIISGALFAFVTSFDEVVVVLFIAGPEQQTIPRQMWIGIREQISPAILAVATLLVGFSIALLATVELLRRRSERIRGVSPG
ncbi:MAG: ABC transporter permease [Paracoccus sp. (in: a-proteobacteria)]|nr:ABC transporter permease [Paracoccus sp. (in: a-proteobacteria)]